MDPATHPFALVSGASSGIGVALARECLDHGFDVLIAADEPAIEQAAADASQARKRRVDAVQADLAGSEGVDRLAPPPVGAGWTRWWRTRAAA